jgi:hypothetical protein
MKPQATIYKGVPLTGNRTEYMIDTIIKKRKTMKTNELAELLGFESFRPVNAICRLLNNHKPKHVVKEAKNTFDNYNGSGKEAARNLIAEVIMETKRQSSNILTLPADKWIMEKNILNKKPGYKFTAVERDKETYKQMMKNLVANDMLSESVINIHNSSIAEVIEDKKEDTFSSLILDYCGHVDSFYSEINDVMKRNLVKKGGFITITLSENDRLLNHPNHLENHSNTYIKNCCVEGEKINGAIVTNALVNILVYNNAGYKITKKFTYRDKVVNMMLFIIKRIEDKKIDE